jgi:hypothetical protein
MGIYSGGTGNKSLPRDWLWWQVFVVFLSLSKNMLVYFLMLGHDFFLSHPFQSVCYYPVIWWCMITGTSTIFLGVATREFVYTHISCLRLFYWSEYHRRTLFLTFTFLILVSGLEIRDYGCGDPLRRPRDTLYQLKLALSSPAGCGRSVGIVCLRTKTTEFSIWYIFFFATIVIFTKIYEETLPATSFADAHILVYRQNYWKCHQVNSKLRN